jgi:hypothetical protein
VATALIRIAATVALVAPLAVRGARSAYPANTKIRAVPIARDQRAGGY